MEYNTFIIENDIDDIDNIKTWKKDKYDNLIKTLDDISKDGRQAFGKIEKDTGEDILTLYQQARNGVIATVF